MSRMLHVTSPMPPSVNHYLGHKIIQKNGTYIPVVYETREAKRYKEEFELLLISAINRQGWDVPVDDKQHFYVDAYYYFDRKGKDASNYEKCLCDAITETQRIWKDDRVALYRPQRILYDPGDPRIELYIYPVEYIGIFDNREEHEKMLGICSTCRKNGRCRIIKDAESGKVTDNIVKEQDNEDMSVSCRRYQAND